MKKQILKLQTIAALKAMLTGLLLFICTSGSLFAQTIHIEAEGYCGRGPTTPPQPTHYAIATDDAGGGQMIVGTTNGSWLDYCITIPSTGFYSFSFRIATNQNFAAYKVYSGATVLFTKTFSNTGGWGVPFWSTQFQSNVLLAAGPQTIRIESAPGTSPVVERCNFNWFEISGGPNIPGLIEAENFSGLNIYPPAPPPPFAVPSCDLTPAPGGGPVMVGFIFNTFMDYNVNVLAAGNYRVSFRYASTQNDDAIQVRSMPSGTILTTVPLAKTTNNWCDFSTSAPSGLIALAAGPQTIRLQLVSVGNVEGINLNWMNWIAEPTGGCFPPTQAESYVAKVGGQYIDGSVDPTDPFAPPVTPVISGFINGSSMDYVPPAGLTTSSYTFRFRVATLQNSVKLQIRALPANTLLGTLTVLPTPGWSSFTTQLVSGIELTAGQNIRIQVLANGSEGCNINWFQICPGVVATTAINKAPILTEIVTGKLAVSVYPNPSDANFSLKVQGKNMDPVSIRVMDLSGRLVQKLQGTPGEVINFGENLKSGTYFVEVRQGLEKSITKVVKN